MFPRPRFDERSGQPLYRQLFEHVKDCIQGGRLAGGSRLPATRELAGLLGLNRATISAAYGLLEAEGLIRGHVGRGSFVTASIPSTVDWGAFAADTPALGLPVLPAQGVISFASSRPAEQLFPLDEFRVTCDEVLRGPEAAAVLQL
ncbi:MAG: GntR family transcriptional regulator, partial [Bryobacteraceae bacterium]